MLSMTVWIIPASGEGKPMCGTAFTQRPGWWVMRKDEDIRFVPQGDLMLDENRQ